LFNVHDRRLDNAPAFAPEVYFPSSRPLAPQTKLVMEVEVLEALYLHHHRSKGESIVLILNAV